MTTIRNHKFMHEDEDFIFAVFDRAVDYCGGTVSVYDRHRVMLNWRQLVANCRAKQMRSMQACTFDFRYKDFLCTALVSYSTVVAVAVNYGDETCIYELSKYSTTTSKQVTYFCRLFENAGTVTAYRA